MVRMSDILKRAAVKPEAKEPQEEKPSVSKEKPKPKIGKKGNAGAIEFSKATKGKEDISEEEQKMPVAKAMHKIHLSPEETDAIYNQGQEIVEKMFEKIPDSGPIDLKNTYSLIENIVERLVLGDKGLLVLSSDKHSPDNYLVTHSLNTTLLSIELGLGKGYNKSRLNELGLCAILHDVGMVKILNIANQPRILTEDEYVKIKEHTAFGKEMLSKIKDLSKAVISTAREHHEQFDGKGYPQHLANGQINEYAQIVCLCNVYEALTHHRPYRKAFMSYDAIKEIVSASSQFDETNIKILIKRLGIFPVGSWVELNTGEIGKVISVIEELPLRPAVNVMFSKDKEKYSDVKSIVLTRQPSIYIKRSVDLEDSGLEL